MINYKILEENTDPLDAVIEKTGQAESAALREWLSNVKDLEKLRRQLFGQLQIEDAKKKNIESYHPFVLDMTEQDRLTVHTYTEAFAKSHVVTEKLKEIDAALEKWEEDKAEIIAQIPELKEVLTEQVISAENNKHIMFKITSAEGKFSWKEVDEAGNTVRRSEATYETEAEAQAALNDVAEAQPEKVAPAEVAPEAEAQAADAVDEDKAADTEAAA